MARRVEAGVAAQAVALAGASAVALGALAESSGTGWILLLAPLVPTLVVAAGFVSGALVGAAATMSAYLLLGIYLGARHPSTGLCFFNCEQIPETFGNTAGPVWFLGGAMAVLSVFGSVLRTPYWRAQLLFACFGCGLLGLGWIALAPERWHELIGLIVPTVLAFSGVMFCVEVARVRRRVSVPPASGGQRD
jgi:hypothetical protein